MGVTASAYCEVQRAEGLPPHRFRRRLVARGRPALLAGLARDWPAVSRWTFDFFRDHYADAPVGFVEQERTPSDLPEPNRSMLALARRRKRVRATMGEFVEQMLTPDGMVRYLIVSSLLKRRPELLDDIESLDAYQLSPWMPAPLRGVLERTPQFWMGPRALVSALHSDGVHNLNVQIHGRKEWFLLPPSDSAKVYFPCREHPGELLHWSPVNPECPDLERFPRFRQARPLRVSVGPGDVLFVPAGWWHYVRYPEPSISVTYFWHTPWSSPLGSRYLHIERLRRAVGLGR